MTRIILLLLTMTSCAPTIIGPPAQPPFDPSASDPKAVEAIDALRTSLSAKDLSTIKQIKFVVQQTTGGKNLEFTHAWDRVHHRHHSDALGAVAMYYIYEPSRGTATYQGRQVYRTDRDKIITTAANLREDHFALVLGLYTMKRSGAVLKMRGKFPKTNVPGGVACDPDCDTIQITIDRGDKKDSYWVHINSNTKKADIIEKKLKTGRLAYAIQKWTTVDGFTFPTLFQNAGIAGEQIAIENIEIGDPQESLYVPRVR